MCIRDRLNKPLYHLCALWNYLLVKYSWAQGGQILKQVLCIYRCYNSLLGASVHLSTTLNCSEGKRSWVPWCQFGQLNMYGVEGKEAAAKLNCWMPCGVSSLSDSSSSLMPLFEGILSGLLRMRLKCCWTKFTSEGAIFRADRFSRTICARLERLSRA